MSPIRRADYGVRKREGGLTFAAVVARSFFGDGKHSRLSVVSLLVKAYGQVIMAAYRVTRHLQQLFSIYILSLFRLLLDEEVSILDSVEHLVGSILFNDVVSVKGSHLLPLCGLVFGHVNSHVVVVITHLAS